MFKMITMQLVTGQIIKNYNIEGSGTEVEM